MDDSLGAPLNAQDFSYLREVSIEGHELFQELKEAGFTKKEALNIVGQMVIDALDSRFDEDEYVEYTQSFEDEDDDDEDSIDDDGDSSL